MSTKKNVKPVPDGYRTLTPYLFVQGGSRAMDFYARAFGAKEVFHMPGEGGKVMHAEIHIGDSVLMLADENPARGTKAPGSGGVASSIFVYLPDVDAAFAQATAAGATAIAPPADMFWGDRFGTLRDPFGHQWMLATHVEDVTPEEMAKRAAAQAVSA